jgi:hypothetical protein
MPRPTPPTELSWLTPAQRPKLARLRDLMDHPEPRDLDWRYEVGGCLQDLQPQGSGYGTGWLKSVIGAVDCTETLAYETRRLVETYDAAAFAQLRDLGLGADHVNLLLRVKDPDLRRRLQREAAADSWSYTRLEAEIHDSQGYQQPRRRRTPRVPNSAPEVRLRELTRLAEHWLTVARAGGRRAAAALPRQLGRLAARDGSRPLVDDIKQAGELFLELQRAAGPLGAALAELGRKLRHEDARRSPA